MTTDQLLAAGLTHSRIRRWTEIGHLHRPYRGVHPLAPLRALAPQGRELAAVRGCGDAAVLCSVSAAVRWGLLRFEPKQIHVLTPSTGRRSPAGIRLHVTKDLPPEDITTRDRIPITTVARTILDLAADPAITDRALESAAAQAERDGWCRRPAQLRTAHRAHHRAGAPRLRRILRIGPRLWRSDEEALAAAAIVEAGLPEPVIAHEVATDVRTYEVDLCFPAHRLVLEFDGGQHALPLDAARDVGRDAALARAGRRTLRVSAATVRDRPDEVVRLVRAARAERTTGR
ncbi:endonuclease domain-containing protein [Paraconexibacter antarcticus]|uniref:Endonuclease domain-containing protein n=1 Tax=Paraconexibacter antarcticus TaxID=2949664 RepID=A0ABY5DY56_9ACTN|nr:endonuclease domain-containing protein [Paraconexibacter antarcticus]